MRLTLLGVASLLAGCSAYNLQPITSPTPDQVVAYADELAVVARPDMTPREYLAASIVYSDQKCEEFFNALSRFKQDASMFDRVLTAAAAAGTPLYPIYHVSQAAQTVFATSILATQTVAKSYAEIYAFTPYSEELRRLVKDAQQTYLDGDKVVGMKAVVQLYSSGDVSVRTSTTVAGNGNFNGAVTRREAFLTARLIANGYAGQCSLANLHALIRESITAAKPAVPSNVRTVGRGRAAGPLPTVGVSSSSTQPRITQ